MLLAYPGLLSMACFPTSLRAVVTWFTSLVTCLWGHSIAGFIYLTGTWTVLLNTFFISGWMHSAELIGESLIFSSLGTFSPLQTLIWVFFRRLHQITEWNQGFVDSCLLFKCKRPSLKVWLQLSAEAWWTTETHTV